MAVTASGTYVNGVTLSTASENPLTVTATGYIHNFGEAALLGETGFAWTVTNYGRIVGALDFDNGLGVGIELDSHGTVTNMPGGYIHGYGYGIWIKNGGGSVANSGTIEDIGNIKNFLPGHTYMGVRIDGGAATVTNSGYIRGKGTSSIGIYLSAGGDVSNSGTIKGGQEAINSSAVGVKISGSRGSITNNGYIAGVGGVYLTAGGSVTNDPGGLIGGEIIGVDIGHASGIVVNHGFILATGTFAGGTVNSYGIDLSAGGSVGNYGTVEGLGSDGKAILLSAGGSVTNGAGGSTGSLISGVRNGVEIDSSTGTVTNSGTIEGTGTGGDGVFLVAGGSVVNGTSDSARALVSGVLNGVAIGDTAGRVTNFGTITGATGVIFGTATSGTVTNSGTITGKGGTAVSFGSGKNLLVVEKGAVFVGAVLGDGAGEIKFAATGTAAMASNISGFSTVVLADGGADSLTLANANFAGISGSPPAITIQGGNDGNIVNAAALTGTDRVIVIGGAGKDVFTGGAGNDIFEFSTADLTAADIVKGDGGTNYLEMTTAGTVFAGGVSGVEVYKLASGTIGNSLTLVSANFTGVTGGTITVNGGSDGNTISEAGVAATHAAILEGGAGNDTLIAGQHAVMTGGAGADVFDLTTPGSTASPDKNTIADFTPGTDEIAFSDKGFSLGLPAASAAPQVLPVNLFSSKTNGTFDNAGERFAYNATNGDLFYDAQGNTAGSSRELVATLTSDPKLLVTDLFYVS